MEALCIYCEKQLILVVVDNKTIGAETHAQCALVGYLGTNKHKLKQYGRKDKQSPKHHHHI